MIKIENIQIYNLQNAIYSARNAYMSWDKSDTILDGSNNLGNNDLNLAKSLIMAGPSHSKFLRQIFVNMDITAPLYFWKEADTYKVGTVANSCSTMHTLQKYPITIDSFSFDNIDPDKIIYENHHGGYFIKDFIEGTIEDCEKLRQLYLLTKDKNYWRALIQILPSGWNQKRTWTANYAVLRNIVETRSTHKLTEWLEFVQIIKKLPYGEELLT